MQLKAADCIRVSFERFLQKKSTEKPDSVWYSKNQWLTIIPKD